jgi:osmotically-inducible protein OsmY
MRRIWFALSVAAAGLILGGTGSRAIADDSSAAANAKEKQEIQVQLENAPDLKNYNITVKVDDGIAVLEGTVDAIWEKKEAQRLAHVDGILGVNNRLEVRPGGK